MSFFNGGLFRIILILVVSIGVIIGAIYLGIGIYAGLFFNKVIPATEGSIEAYYSNVGPYAIEEGTAFDEAGKEQYKYYYPVDMDLEDEISVIVWGNGSHSKPDDYEGLMKHLAGYGFFVIDSYNEVTGTGEPIIKTIDFLNDTKANFDSIFAHLDLNHIGVIGHSQGSTGVINAHTNFGEGNRIVTGISVALPALKWCDPEDVYDTALIQVPWMILTGSQDSRISPEADGISALEKIPDSVDAWFMNAASQGHLAINKNGGKFRGVITAWFAYQLLGDVNASQLFTEDSPEIVENPGWQTIVHKAIDN
ncbi:poly(ethylene terephthalate) hydrolase family protein [Fusibacter bizertensis]